MINEKSPSNRENSTVFFIRRLRDSLEMSQRSFGQLIGKSAAIVRKWENGAPVPMTDLLALSFVMFFLSDSAPFCHVAWFEALSIETMKPNFSKANINALALDFIKHKGEQDGNSKN